eukprot:Sspe_Gene.20621::Locus_7586_Transcript_1_1_Confidence_1.000_Length_3772::g.20621::m.20621/K08832/SRPK3, STK23; serine/threonine-protein kinase SRPK3
MRSFQHVAKWCIDPEDPAPTDPQRKSTVDETSNAASALLPSTLPVAGQGCNVWLAWLVRVVVGLAALPFFVMRTYMTLEIAEDHLNRDRPVWWHQRATRHSLLLPLFWYLFLVAFPFAAVFGSGRGSISALLVGLYVLGVVSPALLVAYRHRHTIRTPLKAKGSPALLPDMGKVYFGIPRLRLLFSSPGGSAVRNWVGLLSILVETVQLSALSFSGFGDQNAFRVLYLHFGSSSLPSLLWTIIGFLAVWDITVAGCIALGGMLSPQTLNAGAVPLPKFIGPSPTEVGYSVRDFKCIKLLEPLHDLLLVTCAVTLLRGSTCGEELLTSHALSNEGGCWDRASAVRALFSLLTFGFMCADVVLLGPLLRTDGAVHLLRRRGRRSAEEDCENRADTVTEAAMVPVFSALDRSLKILCCTAGVLSYGSPPAVFASFFLATSLLVVALRNTNKDNPYPQRGPWCIHCVNSFALCGYLSVMWSALVAILCYIFEAHQWWTHGALVLAGWLVLWFVAWWGVRNYVRGGLEREAVLRLRTEPPIVRESASPVAARAEGIRHRPTDGPVSSFIPATMTTSKSSEDVELTPAPLGVVVDDIPGGVHPPPPPPPVPAERDVSPKPADRGVSPKPTPPLRAVLSDIILDDNSQLASSSPRATTSSGRHPAHDHRTMEGHGIKSPGSSRTGDPAVIVVSEVPINSRGQAPSPRPLSASDRMGDAEGVHSASLLYSSCDGKDGSSSGGFTPDPAANEMSPVRSNFGNTANTNETSVAMVASEESSAGQAGSPKKEGDEDWSGSKDEHCWVATEDEEDPEEYCPGGYHPAQEGDIYNDRYRVCCKLGWGQFSTVWLAHDTKRGGAAALKIAKSAELFEKASLYEIDIFRRINECVRDSSLHETLREYSKQVVRMLHYFELHGPHGTHLVMAFEVLGPNLLKLVSNHNFKGISPVLVKTITKDILKGLCFLHHGMGIAHTDLKPENILLAVQNPSVLQAMAQTVPGCTASEDELSRCEAILHGNWYPPAEGEELEECLQRQYAVKISDLGAARWESKRYPVAVIQTREYRSPEVVLGHDDVGCPMDMWSLACIVFELLTGDFLFDPKKQSAIDKDAYHLALYMQLLGPLPKSMISHGKFTPHFFDRSGRFLYPLLKPCVFQDVLTASYGMEEQEASLLESFLRSMLHYDPAARDTPIEALKHPWLQIDPNSPSSPARDTSGDGDDLV